MVRGTILVADDHAPTREILRELLELDGWTVIEAIDGVEVLREVASGRPDAVVTDLAMPRLGGLQAARTLRGRPETSEIFLLAITAQVLNPAESRAIDSVFDSILFKPVRPELLRKRLAMIGPAA